MLEQIKNKTDTQITEGNLDACLNHLLFTSYKIGIDNKSKGKLR